MNDEWTDGLDISEGGASTITQGSDAYLIDDVHYDRISAILDIVAKPGLDKWKREVGFVKADEIMKASAKLGHDVHAICEQFNRGQDPWPRVRGTPYEPYYTGYVRWFERNVGRVIMVERTVWSRTHGYAGTFDTFAELKGPKHGGKLALLDNKTSKYLAWTYRLQTAAYKGAVLEQNLLPAVDLRGIVFLSSKTPGSCTLVEYDEERYPEEWMVWLGVVDTYRMAKEYEDDWKRRG